MKKYVLDTVALILWLEKRKLSLLVKSILNSAETSETRIIILVMTLIEVGYLSEKKRVEVTLELIEDYCSKYTSFIIEPITSTVVAHAFEIDDIPELHDRLIAGSALKNRSKLITNDPVITRSRFIQAVW